MTTPPADLTGADWFKSSYSGDNSLCVEVARDIPGFIPVRDSKDLGGPVLAFTPEAFTAFVQDAAAGRYDIG